MADQSTPELVSSTPAPISLPNLNVTGKYPWDLVQELVDRAACFNMFVIPEQWNSQSSKSIAKVTGGTFDAALHRFKVDLEEPSLKSGVRATNTIGERNGQLHIRWSLIPDDFEARPGREPQPVLLEPLASQRFVLQEASFIFENGADGFSSFGTGRIFPGFSSGRMRPHAVAVGNITRGSGKFEGLEGNYIFMGDLTDHGELVGNILLRVVDPNNIFRTTDRLPEFIPADDPDPRAFVPDMTYIIFRTEKGGPEQATTYSMSPHGQIRGLNVPQQYRVPEIDFSAVSPGGLQTHLKLGPVIGGELSMSAIDPTHPGPPGTADAPSPFQGVGTYFFRDHEGNDVAGFTPQFQEGRTFAMQLADAPSQPAVRFACFGPLLECEGYFRGAQGLLAAVSGVALMPHLFSLMQVLFLEDPDGRFRASEEMS